jgi:hypothetical protein
MMLSIATSKWRGALERDRLFHLQDSPRKCTDSERDCERDSDSSSRQLANDCMDLQRGKRGSRRKAQLVSPPSSSDIFCAPLSSRGSSGSSSYPPEPTDLATG